MTQINGREEAAATVLSGGMVLALSTLLAAVAVWAALDYLWQAFTQGKDFWQPEIFVRFLTPLGLVGGAVVGFRFGLRMMRSKSSD